MRRLKQAVNAIYEKSDIVSCHSMPIKIGTNQGVDYIERNLEEYGRIMRNLSREVQITSFVDFYHCDGPYSLSKLNGEPTTNKLGQRESHHPTRREV